LTEVGIVLVEQNAKKALEIADNAYLFTSGRVLFKGKPSELLSNPELGRIFLGLGV
jgi:amino acid/amide ABC transporter ATP-binding protein 2, HAAT family (TC 3.A.1.4.-)